VTGPEPRSSTVTDQIVTSLYRQAERLASEATLPQGRGRDFTPFIDRLLASRLTGFPIMLLTLGLVLWTTVVGANYPSQVIGGFLFAVEDRLSALFLAAGAPAWLHGILVLGVYRTLAWVVSVMLPPMAIFFPCFTLLEDLGYLPRVAFNLDAVFKAAGACGKQSLTMCMGLGCNAAGVIACRIIDSPRERLIAILTNNFVICNGRFPTLIALSTVLVNQFVRGSMGTAAGGGTAAGAAGAVTGTAGAITGTVGAVTGTAGAVTGTAGAITGTVGAVTGTAGAITGAAGGGALASLIVVGIVLAGIVATFAVSWLLSRTLLRGVPSFFALELPPFRWPRVGQVLLRSVLDRTLFVLRRAVAVAAPAGALVWILGNTMIGGTSVVGHLAGFLGPFGRLMGLDGFILTAFILGLPANEIVLPILLMGYLSTGMMVKLDSLPALGAALAAHGWTWLTALCYMLFSLLHWPCATTLLTIWKETRSRLWTVAAALIPAGVAFIVCAAVAQVARALGWG